VLIMRTADLFLTDNHLRIKMADIAGIFELRE
jgi:hypothetical protein